jgi:DNA-binding beta-propeller fold protein YncE/mono/diheme cytochrome c family protein
MVLSGCPDFIGVPPIPTNARRLEAVVTAVEAPPAITGGTLTVTPDGRHALAADPDRDAIFRVDLETLEVTHEIPLEAGDRPFRIVADGTDGYFVTLRGTGEVARIDRDFAIARRTFVCPEPRGVEYDPLHDRILVACSGGELVVVDPEAVEVVTTLSLDADLRDVVSNDGVVYVSRFRAAEVIILDGETLSEVRRESPEADASFGDVPAVAWRMTADPRGGVVLVHQRHRDPSTPIPTTPGEYYGSGACSSAIVMGAFTRVGPEGRDSSFGMAGLVLPVDAAVAPDGQVAYVAAGALNDGVAAASGFALSSPAVGEVDEGFTTSPCFSGTSFPDGRQATAVAFDGRGRLVVQTRDPWQVVVLERDGAPPAFGTSTHHIAGTVDLPGAVRKDSGHDLFHEDSGAGIACASCHAEGADDGFVWRFDIGARKTQDLRGGILGTEPFHWSGDLDDFTHLVDEVFVGRMSGPTLPEEHASALARFIDSMPAPHPAMPFDADAVARGRTIFERGDVGCAACHNGDRLSNDATVDVGTGEAFQVPSLRGLAERAPFMHDGCAPTLEARIRATSCGGGDRHGRTSHLDDAEVADLVAYLETL